MRKQSASIVFTNDDYGITLAEHFERTANSVGMKIKQKWEWNRAKDGNDRAKEIVSQLNATDDPGVLFLATHSAEGIKIITTLKDDWESRPCPILGSYAFARSFFIEIAEEYPREFSDPGYYSNNTLFITPFMTDIGGAEAYQFKQSFLRKYGEQPGEISGCYYNAANIAVEAFKKAGIHGRQHIREDRRRIRDALAGFYSEESGVKSISGVIYFDENGDARTHYAVGVWQRQQTMPAFLQYHKADIGTTDILKKVLDGEILLVNGIGMNDIRLVYAGIDNVRLNRLDIKNSSCSLAFDLWFGYSGYFDDAAIEFENSVQPIQLEKPVEEQKWENITKHRYHVEGDFKCDFDFRAYPFDRQMIPIRFRHRSQTNDRVIYIPDIMSLPKSVSGSADGWEMGRIEFYQDAISKNTTLGNPEYFSSDHALSYSRFNTQIEIRRESAGGFAAIKFLPAIAGFLLLCLIHFIGSGRLHIRVLIFMAVLAGTTFFHLVNASALPVQYLTILNYVFFAVYGLTVFSAFKSVRDYRRQNLK
jgi:branched-chain amino acid transport system substrate-binding protein